jgi:hypothetical protein
VLSLISTMFCANIFSIKLDIKLLSHTSVFTFIMNAAVLVSEAFVKVVGGVYIFLWAASVRRFCDPMNHLAAVRKARLLFVEFVVVC